jgi:hypothetical protein
VEVYSTSLAASRRSRRCTGFSFPRRHPFATVPALPATYDLPAPGPARVDNAEALAGAVTAAESALLIRRRFCLISHDCRGSPAERVHVFTKKVRQRSAARRICFSRKDLRCRTFGFSNVRQTFGKRSNVRHFCSHFGDLDPVQLPFAVFRPVEDCRTFVTELETFGNKAPGDDPYPGRLRAW